MLRAIVRSSLALRIMVLILAAMVMVLGIVELRNMPVDALPEFVPPAVQIQTEALGLSAEEVEQLITVPLEQDLLNGVPWLTTIRSQSLAGLSSIDMIFEPGTDLMRARQMVSERLTQAVALPHVSKPPTMLQTESSTSRVMMVGLSSQSLSLIQMSVLARWTIAPRLMGVPGVANVAIWGQRDRQLQVQVDPVRLQQQGVPLLRVLETTANALWVSTLSFVEASTPGSGGFIETANQRLGVRHISPIVSPEGLAQLPIEDTSLRLDSVANVVEDHQPLIGDALNAGGTSLLLVVEKLPGAPTLEMTRALEKALDDMRPGLTGMVVDSTVYRPAEFIQAAIGNVARAMLVGLLFVVLILAAFFFQWRSVLISLVTIPSSLLTAGFVLCLCGATMNTLALAGLAMALGVVVDDAVTDVENVTRRLRRGGRQGSSQSTASIILAALLEVRGAALCAMLIVLLPIVPVLLITGSGGAYFQPLAIAYGLAVLASMLVALTLTPALCLLVWAKSPVERGEGRESPPVRRLQRVHRAALARIIRRPLLTLAALDVVVVLGVATLPFTGHSLLPSFKERTLMIRLLGAPGTAQQEMSRISDRVGGELRSLPGVCNVGVQVGRAVRGDQVVNVSSAELWASIDPAADYDQTAAAIQRVVDGYPGIRHSVQSYLTERSSEVMAEADPSLVVRVYGNSTDVLRDQAEVVENAIAGIKGIAGTRVDLPVQQPGFEIEVDLGALQRHGLKPGDVRRAAATWLSGIQVGNLFEEQKVFDVVVWSTPGTRSSLSSIRDLPIDTPGGPPVRLGDVAQVRIVPATSIIRHDAVRRYVDVIADLQGRGPGAVAADIESRLKPIRFPLEVHAEVVGVFAQRQATHSRMIGLVLATLIGMFILLQAALGSWRLAALSFLVWPSALAGSLLAAFVGGDGISLGTLAGSLLVFGIAARNSISLILHCQRLERAGGEAFGPGLVMRGASERLAPVLTTALATGLAFLPALLMGSGPGLEILRPMAVAVLGGLVAATGLNLFAMPVFYLRLAARRAPDLELTSWTGDPQGRSAQGLAEAPSLGVRRK